MRREEFQIFGVGSKLIPGGARTLEGPNPGQGVGGVSIAQRGPAFVLHLPLNMLETERGIHGDQHAGKREREMDIFMLKERERGVDKNAGKREVWTSML